MDVFTFLTSENFRKSLESDYEEMEKCIEHGANKAVLVLAGSIIEAILVDYLMDINYKGLDEGKILKMDLGKLIEACKEEGIISKKAYDLSTVVKDYRNFIHPGRLVRLKESVDENDSSVAKSLVNIIIKEISEKRLETYGPTAEQIISKIENDPYSIHIIIHLVDSANELEIKRLLLALIPNKYFTLSEEIENEYIFVTEKDAEAIYNSLSRCFKKSFEKASEDVKREVMKKFVSILKTQNPFIIDAHIKRFFKFDYLEYLELDDLEIVKKHLLIKIDKEINIIDLSSVEGIGKFLNRNDIESFLNPLVQVIIGKRIEYEKGGAELFLNVEYNNMRSEVRDELRKDLDSWIDFLKKQEKEEYFEKLDYIRENLETAIPF